MGIPLERFYDILEAREFIANTLAKEKIEWRIETVGKYVKTTKCELYDYDGNYLAFGYGKGCLNSCITGAVFEAAEHYFCQFNVAKNNNVFYSSSHSFINETILTKSLPISILQEQSDGVLPFLEYINLMTGEKHNYPLALSNPGYVDFIDSINPIDTFDYSKLERYCTNSGTAIGCNFTEAAIHGILEAVERDTISKFLINSFIKNEFTALRLILNNSLPPLLLQLKCDAEKEVEHDILIFEFENKYGIPVFCSILKESKYILEIAGYGCSLSRIHALERSLYELVQCYHAITKFYPETNLQHDNNIISKLNRFKIHQKCAKMKLWELCNEIGYTNIEFSKTANFEASSNINKYLEDIKNIIGSKNIGGVFSSVVNNLANGVSIVHSFIDGQDPFFSVTEGCLVFSDNLEEISLF